MKSLEYNTKVKLKVDLTKYHPSLKIGIEGVTVGRQGIWSRNQDRFITVEFPKHTLDVLWDSLKIIDEEDKKEDIVKKMKIQKLAKKINRRVKARYYVK